MRAKEFYEVWKHSIELDFQQNGRQATFSSGHPKQWDMEDARIELPDHGGLGGSTGKSTFIAMNDDNSTLVVGHDKDLLVYSLPDATLVQKIRQSGSVGRFFFQSRSNSRLAISYEAPMSDPRRVALSFIGILDIGNMGTNPDPLQKATTLGTEIITQTLLDEGGWSITETQSLLIQDKILNVLNAAQQLRDVDAGKAFQGHFPPYGTTPFSHDGSYVVYIPEQNVAGILSVTSDTVGLEERCRLIGHTDNIMWAESSPDDRLIGTTSWDGTARLWDASTGKEIRNFKVFEHQLWAGAWSSDGKLLAVGGGDKHVRVYATDSGELLHTFSGFNHWIRTLSFSPDNRRLATGSGSGKLRVFEVDVHPSSGQGEDGKCLQHFQIDFSGDPGPISKAFIELTNAQYTKSGLLVFKSTDGRIYTYDEKTNEKGLYEHAPDVTAVGGYGPFLVSSDGKTLYSAHFDNSIRIWSLEL